MEIIITLLVAFAIGAVGGYIGYHLGRRDSERVRRAQCDHLAETVQMMQGLSHTPMVNGNSILNELNQVRGHAIYSRFPS